MSEQNQTGTALAENAEVESIRKSGQAAVALAAERSRMVKMIANGEWGSGYSMVRGNSLSLAAQTMLADFCLAARANPYYHVDILGGKPFLNEKYWSDRINSDERFVDFRYISISNDSAARAEWGVPEWATHAYICEIRSLVIFAPLDKIRSGEITDWERYIRVTPEANWAGDKPPGKKKDGGTYDADPIGNADPAKSARTRALRRCAAKAFPVWVPAQEERIRKMEQAIEAEFTIVKSDRLEQAAALPPEDGPQGLRIGAGEPTAARVPEQQREQVPVEVGTRPQAQQQGARRARQMREEQEAREQSQQRPEGWQAYAEACEFAGHDPERFALDQLGKLPENATDFALLERALLQAGGGELGL